MRSLSVKLIAGLLASLAGVLLWLGSANLRVLRQNLETTVVLSAQRIAGIILGSTRTSMLHNDRAALIGIVDSIGSQKDVKKIRIVSKTGAIYHSTVAEENGQKVDPKADACVACHAPSARPLETPPTKATFRVFKMGNERVIGLIKPIRNEPACANAACHFHPSSQRILGVLDVVLSLESVDQATAAHERRMRAQVLGSALLMMAITGFLVWMLISRPIRGLIRGVHVLGSGNLAYRFGLRRKDEIGELGAAFDEMAGQLDASNRTLEERIRRKTRELEAAQEKLIHSEKLASLGQLSAAVAHEINNPLAGIFTYAKLLEKKLSPPKPALDWVQTIQHESKRCGEIVNNLLVFARKQHTEIAPADVKVIVSRTVAVIQHKLAMQQIALEVETGDLPTVDCDASQIQQVLLAIAMNAIDAIGNSQGGKLRIKAATIEDNRVDISLTNNGPAIPKEVLPKIFEPFFSTKQAASGVGLGLAVAYGIVKRHGGDIQVETGAETTFHVTLPAGETPALSKESPAAQAPVSSKPPAPPAEPAPVFTRHGPPRAAQPPAPAQEPPVSPVPAPGAATTAERVPVFRSRATPASVPVQATPAATPGPAAAPKTPGPADALIPVQATPAATPAPAAVPKTPGAADAAIPVRATPVATPGPAAVPKTPGPADAVRAAETEAPALATPAEGAPAPGPGKNGD